MKLYSICLIAYLLMACSTPWRAQYLQDANGHTHQDAIASRLGAPDRTQQLAQGGQVWTYQLCNSGGNIYGTPHLKNGLYGTMRSDCTLYSLTFDGQGILRNWVRDTN